MSTVPSAQRIAPSNLLLEGVPKENAVPTFVLDGVGMTESAINAEADRVGMLQAISPSFRVVLFIDLPLFPLAQRYGWPVEHVPSLEHRHRVTAPANTALYFGERRAAAQRRYINARWISCASLGSFAEQIADALSAPELGPVAASMALDTPAQLHEVADWEAVRSGLERAGNATLTTSEGRARIRMMTVPPSYGTMFVTGHATGTPLEPLPAVPDGVGIFTAEFDPDSTSAFEASVYSGLSDCAGERLAVVRPWRVASTLLADSMAWIDLAVAGPPERLAVLPEFGETYRLLAGSDRLTWSTARLFAASRRVARSFSERQGAV